MAFATRAELWTAVSAMLNRGDLDSFMPTAQALTEAVLRRELRAQTVGPVALVLNAEKVSLPDDLAQLRSIYIPGATAIGGGTMSITTPSVIAEHRARLENLAGIPTMCAVAKSAPFNDYNTPLQYLLLAPAPSQPVTAMVTYFQQVPALNTADASNWLLETAPDAYFFGMLVQFAEFLKEDDRIGRWGQAFAGIIEQLNQQRVREEYGAAPTRSYNEYVF